MLPPRSTPDRFNLARRLRSPCPRALAAATVISSAILVVGPAESASAGSAPIVAKTVKLSVYTYMVDAKGKQIEVLPTMLGGDIDTTAVFTLDPSAKVALNQRYAVTKKAVVRAYDLERAVWLTTNHQTIGKPLNQTTDDYWSELAATQLCIWADRGSTSWRAWLNDERVPSVDIRERARALCEAADQQNTKTTRITDYATNVGLDLDVVRSTATKVTLDAYLRDTKEGFSLPNQEVTVQYDGQTFKRKTDRGGIARFEVPRRDRKITASAVWSTRYPAGTLWVPDNSAYPALISAEYLEYRSVVTNNVDPTTLTSGVPLVYQMVSSWLEKHTPLGSQPAAAIGLAVLAVGYSLVLLRGTWALIKWLTGRRTNTRAALKVAPSPSRADAQPHS